MIELRDVCFAYEGMEPCIHHINLHIKQGECVVLMGRSGNGKTTLTRLINGLAPAYYPGEVRGEIRVQGSPINQLKSLERAKLFGNVFQDPNSQFFSSELVGEVAFACENLGFSSQEIIQKTQQTMKEMKLEPLAPKPLDVLSSGEKQKVAIASVRVVSPKIYVFDEPSANLDAHSAQMLAKIMRELKQQGHTLIISEHRLSYLHGIADKYVYLDKGRIENIFTPRQLAQTTSKVRKKLGMRETVQKERPKLNPPGKTRERLTLELNEVVYTTKKKRIFGNISFSCCAGEVVALVGKNGIGKTTLAKIICGIKKESAGQVRISGRKIKSKKRFHTVWYNSNDTNTQLFTNSVEEELLLLLKENVSLEQVRELLKEFGLYEVRTSHPAALSGGQKQRLCIACGLISGRDILIFDEPTSGLDGDNLKRVANAFSNAAKQGKTVLLITHDNELIESCCTSMVELKEC